MLEEVCHCGCGLGSLICVQTTPSETDHLQFQRGKKSVMAEWRQQVAGMVARAALILNHKQKTERANSNGRTHLEFLKAFMQRHISSSKPSL